MDEGGAHPAAALKQQPLLAPHVMDRVHPLTRQLLFLHKDGEIPESYFRPASHPRPQRLGLPAPAPGLGVIRLDHRLQFGSRYYLFPLRQELLTPALFLLGGRGQGGRGALLQRRWLEEVVICKFCRNGAIHSEVLMPFSQSVRSSRSGGFYPL